ncbi:hypothetical protein CONLIGDRAFT_636637 [Coniochaeta ligniaria NRRL 30616]|uniref:Uncharacterized protein n=1 Tax=Coniochaeta ligniaria NRRL 30616 TaxID=1408157 RepID=A0A1J7J3Q5_9PEZI|nr:hypothetical protein CONLIGDRAFT_636637 [Coniochaeta ligniaria NRRL 30616]
MPADLQEDRVCGPCAESVDVVAAGTVLGSTDMTFYRFQMHHIPTRIPLRTSTQCFLR